MTHNVGTIHQKIMVFKDDVHVELDSKGNRILSFVPLNPLWLGGAEIPKFYITQKNAELIDAVELGGLILIDSLRIYPNSAGDRFWAVKD
jgi:hypothetical protein